MIDDKLINDIEKYIGYLDELEDWLNRVYYNEEFSGLFQKPVISMMSTGCDYLRQNLRKLRAKYLSRFEEVSKE